MRIQAFGHLVFAISVGAAAWLAPMGGALGDEPDGAAATDPNADSPPGPASKAANRDEKKAKELKRDAIRKKNAKRHHAKPAERETAALALARENHVELIELLDHLKANKPKEYQRAIQELWRASERLAAVKERDPVRYGLEMRNWKIDSRIRLLTAKLSVQEDTQVESELRGVLAEKADVRLELKRNEFDRVKSRLEALAADIDTLESKREEQLQQSFDHLHRAAAKARAVSAAIAKRGKSQPKTKRPAAGDSAPEPTVDDSAEGKPVGKNDAASPPPAAAEPADPNGANSDGRPERK